MLPIIKISYAVTKPDGIRQKDGRNTKKVERKIFLKVFSLLSTGSVV